MHEARNLLVTAHFSNPHLPGPTRQQLAFSLGSGEAQLAAFYNRSGAVAVQASREAQGKMMVSGVGTGGPDLCMYPLHALSVLTWCSTFY